jgi:hypothetical protein
MSSWPVTWLSTRTVLTLPSVILKERKKELEVEGKEERD